MGKGIKWVESNVFGKTYDLGPNDASFDARAKRRIIQQSGKTSSVTTAWQLTMGRVRWVFGHQSHEQYKRCD